MICKMWLIFKENDIFIAKEWIQGHDGMNRIDPHIRDVIKTDNFPFLLKYLENKGYIKAPQKIFDRYEKLFPDLYKVMY